MAAITEAISAEEKEILKGQLKQEENLDGLCLNLCYIKKNK